MRNLLVGLIVLVLLAPGATAQTGPIESTPTTLYLHIFDTFNKFVVNTQEMDADFFNVGGTNNPTLHGSPVNPVVDELPVATGPWDLNSIYGTSTAGPVEYEFIENGRPRFHPEAGIAADVILDDTVVPMLSIYLDLRDVLGKDGLPTVSPAFALEVTVREGDDPGRFAELNDGNEIMRGKQTYHLVDTTTAPGDDVNALTYWSTFMVLTGACGCGDAIDPGLPEEGSSAANAAVPSGTAAPDGGVFIAPGEDGIVELQVPLEILSNTIPQEEAFNIRLDWYQLEDVFGEDAFASGYIRYHASQEQQPRIDMAIMNPIYAEFLHPQVAAGTLLIHAGVNSPWGTYDVDMDSLKIKVDGPSQPQQLDRVVAQNQHVHGLHDQAAEVTYLWNFRDEGAANGDYEIELEVSNVAGTATAKIDAGFTIEGKRAFGVSDEGDIVEATLGSESEDSPALGLVVGLGALAALAARRRQ